VSSALRFLVEGGAATVGGWVSECAVELVGQVVTFILLGLFVVFLAGFLVAFFVLFVAYVVAFTLVPGEGEG
jgi:hypothetical protein